MPGATRAVRSVPARGSADDVPGVLLGRCPHQRLNASLLAVEAGVAAGCEDMVAEAGELGLDVLSRVFSGQRVEAGQALAELSGPPLAILKAEDRLLGLVGKYSGVASAAARARELAGSVRVVCGGWKKMPLTLKQGLRKALQAGGVQTRILDRPMVYVSKNYLRVLGSVPEAMRAAERLPGRAAAIQVCGETAPIAEEAQAAAEMGAAVVFVDTGRLQDLGLVSGRLHAAGLRERVQLAFAGGLNLEDLPLPTGADADLVDMGRALIDAPLLDCRYRVTP